MGQGVFGGVSILELLQKMITLPVLILLFLSIVMIDIPLFMLLLRFLTTFYNHV